MVAALPDEGDGIGPRMHRHQRAVARMWDGLVVPSDAAWKVGARVLADAPMEPERSVETMATLAASVHQLAVKAHTLTTGEERSLLYGELITTCATCHSQSTATVRSGGGARATQAR